MPTEAPEHRQCRQRTDEERDAIQRALPKVYLVPVGRFGAGPDADYSMMAIAEDGEILDRHVCSHPSWGRHDLHDDHDPRHLEVYTRKFGAYGDGRRYRLVEMPSLDHIPREIVARMVDRKSAARDGGMEA